MTIFLPDLRNLTLGGDGVRVRGGEQSSVDFVNAI